jgi:hypothetical protein
VAALSLFAADNPEEAQQLLEEQAASDEAIQQLLDEENITLDDAVSAKLVSLKESDRVEGELGAIVSLKSKLINFNEKFGVRGDLGEVDAESPEAIFEAKSGPLKGGWKNIQNKILNPFTNPNGKPFVIYAPGWSDKNVQTATQLINNLDTGPTVYITRSPQELIAVIGYLQAGAPPLS